MFLIFLALLISLLFGLYTWKSLMIFEVPSFTYIGVSIGVIGSAFIVFVVMLCMTGLVEF